MFSKELEVMQKQFPHHQMKVAVFGSGGRSLANFVKQSKQLDGHAVLYVYGLNQATVLRGETLIGAVILDNAHVAWGALDAALATTAQYMGVPLRSLVKHMSTYKNEWREAVLDELAVTCQDCTAEESPKEVVDKIIKWHTQVALDPSVSEAALALKGSGIEDRETFENIMQRLNEHLPKLPEGSPLGLSGLHGIAYDLELWAINAGIYNTTKKEEL